GRQPVFDTALPADAVAGLGSRSRARRSRRLRSGDALCGSRRPGGARRGDHRRARGCAHRAAGDCTRERRDRAAAVHLAQQSILEPEPQRPHGKSARRYFPVALSPYADWQKLAWIGASLITFTVLALSIVARACRLEKELMTSVAVTVPERAAADAGGL